MKFLKEDRGGLLSKRDGKRFGAKGRKRRGKSLKGGARTTRKGTPKNKIPP